MLLVLVIAGSCRAAGCQSRTRAHLRSCAVVSVDPPHVSSRAAATIRSSSNTVASERSSAAPTVVHKPHLSHGSVDGPASAKTAVRDLIWDPKSSTTSRIHSTRGSMSTRTHSTPNSRQPTSSLRTLECLDVDVDEDTLEKGLNLEEIYDVWTHRSSRSALPSLPPIRCLAQTCPPR